MQGKSRLVLAAWLAAGVAAGSLPCRGAEDKQELTSPDGRLVVRLAVQDVGKKGVAVYSVFWQGRPIVVDSALGLVLRGAPSLDQGLHVAGAAASSQDQTWRPVCGERSTIRDHYNQLDVDLADSASPPRRLRVTFRAYDEGAAFCYTLPAQEGLGPFTLAAEETRFHFAGDPPAWVTTFAQGTYAAVPVSRIVKDAERPLTIQLADDAWVAIAEARLVDYARMRLRTTKGEGATLLAALAGEVTGTAPFTTPWRVLLVGKTPGELLEHNDLFLNLNEPCALADTSWIRPGKVIREVTLSTAGGKACVDFAVARGLRYVEYDAGWYGPEDDPRSDARQVNLDPKRSRGPLDLHEVIRYGQSKGIGILLYVNHKALERQLDEILPLYQAWGVQGVKYGFVNVGSQKWTAWLHEAIRKAAACRLMVDIHDEYRPTGYRRTYPNLMTMEGVGGNETMPTAEHNATLPFTRFLAGPADATICWYCNRIKTSHAHQLGASVVFFSPWQFLFWYDRPSDYKGEAELDFWKHLPTVWDDTKVLDGQIGRYVVIARRSGGQWYVGALNAGQRRELEVPLSFLEAGRKYAATLYGDADPEGKEPLKVKIDQATVDSAGVLKLTMAANGGAAIRLVPGE